MTARDLDAAAQELRNRQRRAGESALLGLVCAGLCAASALLAPGAAFALGGGALFQTLIAAASLIRRRSLLARLALEPEAYQVREVRLYGDRLTRQRQRVQLARGIRSMIRDALNPSALYLGDRVLSHARELDALARDLLSPSVRVHPASIARCRALLTEAAESPLYNPRLPADDLAMVLRRIRAGIESND